MDTMPLNVVILGAIPEAILIIYLGLVLTGLRPERKRVILAGILQGISTYFIRRYFHLGMHTLVLYTTLALYTWIIVKVPLFCALFSNILGVVLNGLLEGSISLLIMSMTGLSFAEILSRSWLRIICLWPQQLIKLSSILLCLRYNFTLEQEMGFLRKLNGKTRS